MSPRPSRAALAAVLALVFPVTSLADDPGFRDKEESFGAVAAPAALPGGATAAYGYVGVPEVGAGFRQGIAGFEWEARAKLNYLLLSLAIEGVGRYPVNLPGRLEVAPFLGLGLVGNSGARYFDTLNFAYLGLRLLGGAAVTYRLVETVRLVGRLDVPFDLPLGRAGGSRLEALLGGGAELYLGRDVSALLLGQVGPDLVRPPGDVTHVRLGYSIKLGLGYRFF